MDQGAEPSGILGAVVLAFMQNMNKGPRSLMQEAASLKPGEAVLELGCADGHALVEIAKRVAARSNNSKPANALQKGAVIGVDPSASAIESAKRLLNSVGPVPGVAAKAVCASVGAADGMIQLPIRENSCDAVLHANCVYFWEDLEAGMTDVFRCLKPGGRQVFVAAPEAVLQRNHKANPVFRNVSHAEYIAALKAAGFVKVRSEAHASDDKYHGGEQGGSDGGPAGEYGELDGSSKDGARRRRSGSQDSRSGGAGSSAGAGGENGKTGGKKQLAPKTLTVFTAFKPA